MSRAIAGALIAPILALNVTAQASDFHVGTQSPLLGAASVEGWLPLSTRELSPGDVNRGKIRIHLQRPVFVIGSDERSIQWFHDKRDYLAKNNAMGLLVQANNRRDLERVADIANGIEVLPVAGGVLAEAIGLKHYPALLMGNQVFQ